MKILKPQVSKVLTEIGSETVDITDRDKKYYTLKQSIILIARYLGVGDLVFPICVNLTILVLCK